MIEVLYIPPDRHANAKNYVYYLKRQSGGGIKENNSKCAGRGQRIMPYVLYQMKDGFHPLNIITEEIYSSE